MGKISIFKVTNEKNFDVLIEENKLKFYKTAKTILKNDDDVYDAIQEALISIYQNFDKLENKNYFSTWGIRIVINKCYDMIRKNKKDVNMLYLDDEENSTEIPWDDKKNIEKFEMQDLINHLDDELKLITTLYYYDDLSIKQISEMLNKPQGTIKFKLSQIRNELRTMIGKGGK